MSRSVNSCQFVVSLLLVGSIRAGEGEKAPAAILGSAPLQKLLDTKHAAVKVELSDVDSIRRLVWQKYSEEQSNDPRRREEQNGKKIPFGKVSMRFEHATIGKKPKDGYPLYIALHGGGGAPARVNDSQWRHMMVYYRTSVKEGVYVAPRGVTDTWNLHFRGESYPLYDRLIENMILFADVDPNRVYLLGFSAGGDGVYQVTPRLADRWAAANMSAGHHNGTSPKNLYRVPFLLQVGEKDERFTRHQETVKFMLKLAQLKKEHPDGYLHAAFVHENRGHNFLDNDPKESKQNIMADPEAWLMKKDRRAVPRNTNAITWVSQHRRNPSPERLVWDLKTQADRSGRSADGKSLWTVKNRGKQFYWLDAAGHDAGSLGVNEVIAKIDRKENAVMIEKAGTYLRILLSQRSLDLSKPVTVTVESRSFKRRVRPNLATMVRTCLERGDPNYIFDSELVLEKKDDQWRLSGASEWVRREQDGPELGGIGG